MKLGQLFCYNFFHSYCNFYSNITAAADDDGWLAVGSWDRHLQENRLPGQLVGIMHYLPTLGWSINGVVISLIESN